MSEITTAERPTHCLLFYFAGITRDVPRVSRNTFVLLPLTKDLFVALRYRGFSGDQGKRHFKGRFKRSDLVKRGSEIHSRNQAESRVQKEKTMNLKTVDVFDDTSTFGLFESSLRQLTERYLSQRDWTCKIGGKVQRETEQQEKTTKRRKHGSAQSTSKNLNFC